MIGMQTLFASNAIQNPQQKASRAPFNDAFRPKNAGIVTCSTGLASSCLLLFWETSIFSFYSSIESKWDWETFFSLSSEFKWRDVSYCRFANYFSLCDISQVLFRHFHWGRGGHMMWLMSGLATQGATPGIVSLEIPLNIPGPLTIQLMWLRGRGGPHQVREVQHGQMSLIYYLSLVSSHFTQL